MHSVIMNVGIDKLPEYISWYEGLTDKFKAQVEKRLSNIELHGHYGHVKDLERGLYEIKFNSGHRIYFARTAVNRITLLLGGNKNGQDKDIRKARTLLAG